MGNSEESAEARAEALARRAEEAAARAEAQRAAAAQVQAPPTSQDPPLVAATAAYVWDPLGDDPNANHNDGQPHPEEDAIADREALREAKMDAWKARFDRLLSQHKYMASQAAESHYEWHLRRLP